VFITGHTGFKGGWLTLWLSQLGARIFGYALDPGSSAGFFSVCNLAGRLATDCRADIRDTAALREALSLAQPEIVFHLAAQPLVRHSYREPVDTFDINVIGTARVLDEIRRVGTVRAVVVVTTDKCYENREWEWPYRENDPLGGSDPYSASKAAAELVVSCYRRSFLNAAGTRVATARAGNVIGGGDWAEDRLLPDFLRASDAARTLSVRAPHAIRPWQHVLEPLSGYLLLAERMLAGEDVEGAWNFGPQSEDMQTVGWICDALRRLIPGAAWSCEPAANRPHEAATLTLDSSKARQRLGWSPRWRLRDALTRTVDWHRAWRSGVDMAAFSAAQISAYETAVSTIAQSVMIREAA